MGKMERLWIFKGHIDPVQSQETGWPAGIIVGKQSRGSIRDYFAPSSFMEHQSQTPDKIQMDEQMKQLEHRAHAPRGSFPQHRLTRNAMRAAMEGNSSRINVMGRPDKRE